MLTQGLLRLALWCAQEELRWICVPRRGGVSVRPE